MLVYQRIHHIISIQGEHHVQIRKKSIHHIAPGDTSWITGKMGKEQIQPAVNRGFF